MRLTVGDRVLMEFSTFEDRFLCVVADLGRDGSLTVHAPIPPKVAARLDSDRRVFVKFAHEGRLHGFRSEALDDSVVAGGVLHIAGPGEILDVEQRREPRCQCRFPAAVICEDRAASGVVEDMSVSCARVRLVSVDARTVLGDGAQPVRLVFHPFDPQVEYAVDCTVVRTFMREGEDHVVLEYAETGRVKDSIARFVASQTSIGLTRL